MAPLGQICGKHRIDMIRTLDKGTILVWRVDKKANHSFLLKTAIHYNTLQYTAIQYTTIDWCSIVRYSEMSDSGLSDQLVKLEILTILV